MLAPLESLVLLIPKVFHRVWLGGKPMPEMFQKWGQTWLDLHPGWVMKTWSEEDLPPARFPEILAKIPHLAGRSDVYRYEILLREGGVYIDTDIECLKNIEPLIHDLKAFVGQENANWVGNSIIGATPNHPALAETIEQLPTANLSQKLGVGPPYLNRFVTNRSDFKIFPEEIFYPFGFGIGGREVSASKFAEKSYAVHRWSSTFYPDSFALPSILE
jgi:hypothetical protein